MLQWAGTLSRMGRRITFHLGSDRCHRQGSDRGVQGRRIRGFEGARAPPERVSAPSHCQKHPLKMKEKLMKRHFKPISIKVMVVLTFILGL